MEPTVPTKRCSRCGDVKPLAAFYRNRSRRDGRTVHCGDCMKTYNRAWHAANRRSPAYRQAAIERARARRADLRSDPDFRAAEAARVRAYRDRKRATG
jgi:hypothetical protein